MKAAGTSRPHPPLGKLVSLAILAIAIALGFYALRRSALLPSTDAATIDADIVHVAASVGGRIIMPVGREPYHQRLIKLVRYGEHDYHERSLGAVSFLPLIGEDGWAAC